jgi:hypothetical protein
MFFGVFRTPSISVQSFCLLGLHEPPKYSTRAPCAAKSQPITSKVAPNDRSDADESKSVKITAVQASTRLHASPEGSIVSSTCHHSLTRASTRRERSSHAFTRRKPSLRVLYTRHPRIRAGSLHRLLKPGFSSFGSDQSTVHGFRASAHTTDPSSKPVQPIKPTGLNFFSGQTDIYTVHGFGSARPTYNRHNHQPGSAGSIHQPGSTKPPGSSSFKHFSPVLPFSSPVHTGSNRFHCQHSLLPPSATSRHLRQPSGSFSAKKKKKIPFLFPNSRLYRVFKGGC